MDVNMYSYPAGDPQLIDKIYNEFLSQGRFDKLRKECMANADTKPAYQNLQQRVENTVTQFLRKQTWKPDLNKNHLRDSLRKHILDSGFLDSGINRIVDQVVNPNVLQTVFLPEVEEVVYSYFNIPRPVDRQQKRNEPAFLDNNLNPPGVVESNDFQIEIEIGSRSEDLDANGNRSEILFDRLKREVDEKDDLKNQNFENELKDKKMTKITDSTESLFEKISNESFCTEDKSEIGNDSKENNNPAAATEEQPDIKPVEKMELPSDESQESLSRIGVEKLQITNEADNNTNGPDSDSQGGLEIDERTMSESENSNDSILQAMSPISQGRMTPDPDLRAEPEIKQEAVEPEAEKPRETLPILEEKHPLTFVGRIPKIKKEEEEKGKSVESDDSDEKKKVEEKKDDKKRDDKRRRDDKDRKKDDKSRRDRSRDRKKDDKSKRRDDKDKDRDRRGDKSKERSDKKSSSSSHRSSSSSHHKSSHRDDSRSRDRDRGRHDDKRRDDRKRSDDRKKREDDKKKKSKSVDDHSKERNRKDDRRSTDRDSNEREKDKSLGSSRSQSESSRRKEKETKGESSREKTGREEKDRNERRSKFEEKEIKKPKTEKKVYFSPDDEVEEIVPQEQTEFSFDEIQKIIFGTAVVKAETEPEKSGTEVAEEPENKTETEAVTESEVKTEPEPETESESKPETESENKPEIELVNQPEPEVVNKSEPEVESKTEPEVEIKPESENKPEPEVEKTPPPNRQNYPDLLKEGALKKHTFPPVSEDFYQKFESTGFKYFEDWESGYYDCEDEFKDFIARAENDLSLISDDESLDSEFNFDETNKATVRNTAEGFGNFDGGLMLDPVSGDFYSWTNKIFYDKVSKGDRDFLGMKTEMETDEDLSEEKNKENQELKKSRKKSYKKEKNSPNKILCFSNNKKTDDSDLISALSDEKLNEVPEDNISPPLSEDNETEASSEKTPNSDGSSEEKTEAPKMDMDAKIHLFQMQSIRRQQKSSEKNKTPKGRILARVSSSKSDDLDHAEEEEPEEKTEAEEVGLSLGKRKGSEEAEDTPNKIKKEDLKLTVDSQPRTKPKIRLGLPKPKPKNKTPKANNSPVNKFSMPLSPESDDTPLNNGAPIPGLNKRKRAPFTSPNVGAIPLKKNIDTKKRTLQQKYDSQDLYKPRPILTGSRTRNRSLGVVESPTTKANNVED